jgi:glycosyltransferase involved in cell wall biosynthesis
MPPIDPGLDAPSPPDRDAPPASGRSLRVAMALYKDVTHDSRVLREAWSLADAGHEVTIHCLGGRLPAGAPFRAVAAPAGASEVVPGTGSPFLRPARGGRLRRVVDRITWLLGYMRAARRWGRRVVAAAGPVDVWHAHDLNALAAVGPFVRGETVLVFDSHEEFLETGSALRLPGPARSALRWLERRLISRSFAVVTVNDGIAADLRAAYAPERLVVVRNCPPRWTAPAERPDLLRAAFGIPGDAPVLLFHGSLVPDRGIEQVVRAIERPELRHVHLVLLGDGELAEPMTELGAGDRLGGRLHVHAAVTPQELPDWVASADLGVVIIPPRTRNLYLSTPNKLFECLAVGTPVLASDLPEMRRVVLEDPDGPLGAVCDPDDEDAVVAAIGELLGGDVDVRRAARERCLRAAASRLNWEHEVAGLVALYGTIADRSPGAAPA